MSPVKISDIQRGYEVVDDLIIVAHEKGFDIQIRQLLDYFENTRIKTDARYGSEVESTVIHLFLYRIKLDKSICQSIFPVAPRLLLPMFCLKMFR